MSRRMCAVSAVVGVCGFAASIAAGQRLLASAVMGEGVDHQHGAACESAGNCGKARAAARWDAWVRANGGNPSIDPDGDALACDVAELTDLINCNLQIESVVSSTTISGSNAMTITSLTDGLTTFTFRLRSQYVISSVTVTDSGGVVTPVTFTSPTTTTRIAALPRPFNTGETFTLTVVYSGTAVNVGGFGAILFTTQTGNAAEPIVQTLSQPYYAYTWWPCKDGDVSQAGDNSDKFTIQMGITAPGTMESVGPGVFQGVDALSGGRLRYRWASSLPISTYLVFFASTNYNQWQKTYSYPLPGGGTGTMPVHFSIYPVNDNAANRTAAELSLQMMATLRPYYGEYPFVSEKFGIYQFEFGGGMEHQTYCGQINFSEYLTAHELGHQWWGDNITCKTWSDIWLNEGFASYTEALWAEKKPGSSGLPALKSYMTGQLPVTTQTGTVYKTNVGSINAIFDTATSYNKGAWVVHMMRRAMGDTTFWQTLAQYRSQFNGKAASTADFRAVCEAVTGRSWSAFFNQWVYGAGLPAYAVGLQSAVIDGQNYAKVRVRQAQTANSVVFDMPVDVRFTVGGVPVTSVVRNNAQTEWFLIPTTGAASSVSIDPDSWILATGRAAEAYVAGPPKVVTSSVSNGAVFSVGSAPASISIRLSESATVPAGAVTLAIVETGAAVPVSVAGGGGSPIVVTPNSPLAAGTYDLRLADTIVANGFGLDGELVGPNAGLPSGDGVPGGVAVIRFTVQGASCYANCDGSSDLPVLGAADFSCFLNKYRVGDAYANCDGSTVVPVLGAADFSCFLARYRAGC